MGSEAFVFLFAVVVAAVLLFAMVFFIIMFSDLECDYINPIDLCSKLNQYVLAEYCFHLTLPVCFLVTGNWIPLVLNLPLVGFHLKKYLDHKHRYDPTEIFRTLHAHKREALTKLGFYLVCFFYYLYRMIVGLIAEA